MCVLSVYIFVSCFYFSLSSHFILFNANFHSISINVNCKLGSRLSFMLFFSFLVALSLFRTSTLCMNTQVKLKYESDIDLMHASYDNQFVDGISIPIPNRIVVWLYNSYSTATDTNTNNTTKLRSINSIQKNIIEVRLFHEKWCRIFFVVAGKIDELMTP